MSPVPPPPIPPELQDPPETANGTRTPIGRSPANQTQHLMQVMSVAMGFGYAVVGCALLGFGLDWLFKTAPRWLVILSILGVLVGGYRFVKDALRLMKADTKAGGTSGDPEG